MELKHKLDEAEKICFKKLDLHEHTILLETFRKALTTFCLLSFVIGALVGVALAVGLGALSIHVAFK